MPPAEPSAAGPADDLESDTAIRPLPGGADRRKGAAAAMTIGVASDHRGTGVKDRVLARVRDLGHEARDFGPAERGSVDYPDFAELVAQAVADGDCDRGILICGSGLGMCIVANKFPGVRAVPCHDDLSAEVSRMHNDSNVLCLSADLLGERLIDRMIELWLSTDFEGGRHARRVEKIAALERRVAGR